MPIWLFLLRCFHRFLFSIDKIHTSMGYSYECTCRFIRFSLSIIMKPVDRERGVKPAHFSREYRTFRDLLQKVRNHKS